MTFSEINTGFHQQELTGTITIADIISSQYVPKKENIILAKFMIRKCAFLNWVVIQNPISTK
jgi:hypothetical protein